MISELEENIQKLNRIERNNLFILIAFILGSALFQSLPIFLGVVVGGVLFSLNFHILRQIIITGFGHGKMGPKAFLIKILLKFFLFFGIIGAVLYFAAHDVIPVDLLAFAIGALTILIASGYEGLRANKSPVQH